MSPELIAILITAAYQSVLLIAAMVMVYLVYKQGRLNDRIMILQNRRIEDVLNETNKIIREELLKG
jgi:hypothetical protein